MIPLFIILLCSVSTIYRVDGTLSTSKEEDLALETQFKLLNKPPTKSIVTEFGYIVDCIDINKQLAFDHPLLKNHQIQKKPSFKSTLSKSKVNGSLAKLPRIGLEKGACPKGTVPIRRTTKEDLLRMKSLSINNNAHILTQENPGTHVAVAYLGELYDTFYGVSGTLSIYKPQVQSDQSSAAHVWVQNGDSGAINAIYLGWQVSPQLYGDDNVYVYSQWTCDSFKKTGCYNMQCPGFVQTDKQVYLGARVDHTSIYGGTQAEMTISINQDEKTQNWWLRIGNVAIGYFPAGLFSNMKSSDHVGYGGKTMTPVGRPSPQMGSGYFPDDNFVHADYFRHVAFQNGSRIDFGPEKNAVTEEADNKDCFDVKYYGNLKNPEMGYSLLFGGPGGNCGD